MNSGKFAITAKFYTQIILSEPKHIFYWNNTMELGHDVDSMDWRILKDVLVLAKQVLANNTKLARGNK